MGSERCGKLSLVLGIEISSNSNKCSYHGQCYQLRIDKDICSPKRITLIQEFVWVLYRRFKV